MRERYSLHFLIEVLLYIIVLLTVRHHLPEAVNLRNSSDYLLYAIGTVFTICIFADWLAGVIVGWKKRNWYGMLGRSASYVVIIYLIINYTSYRF